MYKNIALFILLTCSSLMVFSQNAIIKGSVTDESTKEALMGALIVAEGTNNAVESDLDGNFSLSLPAGTYKIIASYEAYLSDTFNIKLSPNQIITKDFALKASWLLGAPAGYSKRTR